jgi:hypothetical protein
MQYIQLQGQVGSQLDTPLEGGFNLFIDTNDGSIKAKDSDGNLTSAGGGLVETTYSEISASFVGGTLTPGTYYKITDFKTCYDQPNYNVYGNAITVGNYKTGSVSPIIVFALDSGSLASDAYQPKYPKDNIKYDITFNQTEITTGSAYGRIVYRKDNRGNVFDYDFREVRFKRYDAYISDQIYNGTISLTMTGSAGFITGSETAFTNFNSGSVIGVLDRDNTPLIAYYSILEVLGDHGMVVTGSWINEVSNKRLVNAFTSTGMSYKQNNILTNTNEYEYLTFDEEVSSFNTVCTNPNEYTIWDGFDFLLSNNVFKDGSYEDNSFGINFRNNTIDDDCDSNVITGNFSGNIITNDFDNNVISGDFYNNVIDCDFRYNQIIGNFSNNNLGDYDGDDFDNNLIRGNFYNNFYIGEGDFHNNTFNDNFNGNIILRGFRGNDFNYAYNNVFTYSCDANKIGNNFYDNTFYQYVSKNTISNDFYNNIFHSDFNGNTIGFDFYGNTLGELGGESYFQHNQIGNNFHGNTTTGDLQHNVIGNNFYDNTIGINFCYNQIRNDFDTNTIGDDFGFGGSVHRGNVIGNNFNHNTIGEYFYDNNIGDNFEYNSVGEYFQFNRIEAAIGYTDFTEYYGNLFSVTFPNNVAGTNGTYSNVTGITSGIGFNAEFEIIVSGSLVSTVSVTTNGKLYRENDTITIASGSFGGTANLVLTENGLSLTPEVYRNYNKTIQKAGDGTNVITVILPGEGYFPYITPNITQAID